MPDVLKRLPKRASVQSQRSASVQLQVPSRAGSGVLKMTASKAACSLSVSFSGMCPLG